MAQIVHYDQGDVWVPQATFTVGGTPTDPSSLIVRIKKPDGTITTITENTPAAPTAPIVRVSAGVFKHSGIALDAAGYWFLRFEGTGTAAATEEHQVIVDPSEFTANGGLSERALIGLAETKDWLQQQNINTSGDLELVRVINDLSQRFHEEAGREIKPIAAAASERSFVVDSQGVRQRTVRIGDAATVTQVQIVDTDWATVLETVAASDYTLHPLVREAWEPIRRIEFHSDVTQLRSGMRVEVTGTWGFPAVPGSVRQAVLDAVAEAMDRDVEHWRQDFAPQTGGEAQNVIVFGRAPLILSMPPRSLAVARSLRDPLVA